MKTIRITHEEIKTQKDAIKWHLKTYGKITSWEAIKEYGASTLDPDVMKIYFKEYNDNLDIAFADSDRLKEMSDVKPTQMVKEEKGAFNCAK